MCALTFAAWDFRQQNRSLQNLILDLQRRIAILEADLAVALGPAAVSASPAATAVGAGRENASDAAAASGSESVSAVVGDGANGQEVDKSPIQPRPHNRWRYFPELHGEQAEDICILVCSISSFLPL